MTAASRENTMTTGNIPSIEGLDFQALMQLREQIDARLDQIRSEFMAQATVMGLACSVDGPKKRGRRRTSQKDPD
jgi:hypothetical protein